MTFLIFLFYSVPLASFPFWELEGGAQPLHLAQFRSISPKFTGISLPPDGVCANDASFPRVYMLHLKPRANEWLIIEVSSVLGNNVIFIARWYQMAAVMTNE